ncbi:helix-turn-helix domain-containing protein [Nitrincola iocasae]|uniref:Helix-turn-helix domain-containing protein n=1 Tax=Nitrincola iocasae TaxID=2614693 RepID=A0A5J6LIS5_9GAMM|nr:helix-turn-helix domain-containing protein [Nitrincola iocasae]QEW08021.1 helix-turn-helix domain-containing protein [Nitrincola iocasae]
MSSHYQVVEQMLMHKADLRATGSLSNDMGLARWYNSHDLIELDCPSHHTLSLYVAEGLECYRRTQNGWKNGGAPGRFCLMPKGLESAWDVRGPLEFVHLYFTDQHLLSLAEQIWDRSPASLQLNEQYFAEDASITALYQQFLLSLDWQERSHQLALSSASNLLLIHLLRSFSQCQWHLPRVTGGLAPSLLKRIQEYIETYLDQPLLLRDLAEQACLSEYHFSRMFSQSLGIAPHQYVLQRRLRRAEQLLQNSPLSLTEIAQQCGFSSSSHFSNRFRQSRGMPPSQLRQATENNDTKLVPDQRPL